MSTSSREDWFRKIASKAIHFFETLCDVSKQLLLSPFFLDLEFPLSPLVFLSLGLETCGHQLLFLGDLSRFFGLALNFVYFLVGLFSHLRLFYSGLFRSGEVRCFLGAPLFFGHTQSFNTLLLKSLLPCRFRFASGKKSVQLLSCRKPTAFKLHLPTVKSFNLAFQEPEITCEVFLGMRVSLAGCCKLVDEGVYLP